MTFSQIFAQVALKMSNMRKKRAMHHEGYSYELDWNPGDISSILNFADYLLNDIEQLSFGFCVSVPKYALPKLSIQNLAIQKSFMPELGLVTFHTVGNTAEAGISGGHLCTHAINHLTA